MRLTRFAKLHYLMDCRHCTPDDAMDIYDRVPIVDGNMEDFVRRFNAVDADELSGIPDYLRPYIKIDYAQMAYDMNAEGQLNRFHYLDRWWTCGEIELF